MSQWLFEARVADTYLVDVRQNTTSSNSSLNHSIQFRIASNRKLKMSRGDSLDFEIFRGVSCANAQCESRTVRGQVRDILTWTYLPIPEPLLPSTP